MSAWLFPAYEEDLSQDCMISFCDESGRSLSFTTKRDQRRLSSANSARLVMCVYLLIVSCILISTLSKDLQEVILTYLQLNDKISWRMWAMTPLVKA
jgi:hypothetical protein